MALYSLRSGSNILVTVEASSNLDGVGKKSTRRGTVLPTLADVGLQYMETAVIGDARVEWRIPLASGSRRGLLQSASNGSFGDKLILAHPTYGDIQVAVIPGAEGYTEVPYEPVAVGYEVTLRFLRLE